MPSWRTCEWQQLLSTKSTTRYLPPKGTALTARSLVNTLIRSLPPPASTNAITSRTRSPKGVGQGGMRTEARNRAASSQAGDTAPAGCRGYQLYDADTRCVMSSSWSLGKLWSSEAKKRWRSAA